MTVKPVSIGPDELASEAVSVLEQGRKTQLVVDAPADWINALHMRDLLRAKVV